MPKNATLVSDSDVEMEETPNNNNSAANGGNNNAGAANEDEGSVEEFEIEAILGHKYNMKEFAGRIGYLVKWKGFSDAENSYVDEQDASGAADLIDAYWKRIKKTKTKGRKSNASAVEPSDDVAESSSAPPKKRGRPLKSKTPDIEISDDEEEAPKKKPKAAQPRKSASSSAKGRKSEKRPQVEEEVDDLSVEDLGNMDKWKDAASWEHLVDSIDTVERTKDNDLIVYFTLNNKAATKSGFQRVREKSDICKKKMPEKLLNFYESNLRWREDNSDKES